MWLALFTFLTLHFTHAEDSAWCPPETCRNGELFSLRVVPQNKQLIVQVAGRKSAIVESKNLGMKAYLVKGNDVSPLTLTQGPNSSYMINESIEKPADLRFDLQNDAHRETITVPFR